jgi:HSP20 family protein
MSTMVRFDPFGALRELDRWFESPATRSGTWAPRVDVFDKDGTLVVRAEVPGVKPEDIEVTVEGGVLSITGSRSFTTETEEKGFHRKEIFEGSFCREIMLPEGTDPASVKAVSKDGILEVVVPRSPEVLPRKVTVEIDQ